MPQMEGRSGTIRRFLFIATACAAMIGSFFAGRFWEHFKNGRWYQVHDSRVYDSPLGSVYLRHVTDTQGWPFLDPGTSVVGFQDGTGDDVVLYRARRVFQEEWPWVDGVQVAGNDVRWSDGQYNYSLHIERNGPTTQP